MFCTDRWLRELLKVICDFQLWHPFVHFISSICIFKGFSLLRLCRDFSRLAGHAFMIYLVHEGIWEIFTCVIKHIYGFYSDSRILIPLSVVSVFLLSFIVSCGIRNLERVKVTGS